MKKERKTLTAIHIWKSIWFMMEPSQERPFLWHPPGGNQSPTQSIQPLQGAIALGWTLGCQERNKRNWPLFLGGESEVHINICIDMQTGSK
jgi:hypothetical protein